MLNKSYLTLHAPGVMNMKDKIIIQRLFIPRLLIVLLLAFISSGDGSGVPGAEYDYGAHPKFVCTPIPADADPSCFPAGGAPGAAGPAANGNGHHGPGSGGPNSWWGMTEDAKTTILHLRENLVQQKETILDQRETIRELTAKLTLCEGFGRGVGGHDDHHGPHLTHHPYPDHSQGHGNHIPDPLYPLAGHRSDSHHRKAALGAGDKHRGDTISSSPEQMGRMLQALKERLENLQSRNTSNSYSNSLRDLLQRKINALEQQMHHYSDSGGDHHADGDHHDDHHDDDHHGDHYDDDDHHDDHHDDRHDDHHDNHHDDHHDDGHPDDDHHDDHDSEADGHGRGHPPRTAYHSQGHRAAHGLHPSKLDAVLNHLHHRNSDTGSRKKPKSPDAFQIGFPMRTNYMYGRVKRTLLQKIFSLTLCLWLRGAGSGLGTPFSYSVSGQANELVLIEWGNNPMELLVNDKAVTLPLSLTDGKWHHLCVTWSTRDGVWEAYQDGVKRGSGENLSAWHPIKPGGVFILGQEQDTLGGRFDATQAFVGEISDLQLWSHVLTAHEIYNLASCGSHLTGDVIAWTESVVELHGGVTKYPFDPCH